MSAFAGLAGGVGGALIGSLAGFYGGWLDHFVNLVVINSLLAFPGILLALAFVAFLGPGIGKLVMALSLTGWIGYARLIRELCAGAFQNGRHETVNLRLTLFHAQDAGQQQSDLAPFRPVDLFFR